MPSSEGHSNKKKHYKKQREGALQIQEGCDRLPENNRGEDRHRKQVNQAKHNSSQRVPSLKRESRSLIENINHVAPVKTHKEP